MLLRESRDVATASRVDLDGVRTSLSGRAIVHGGTSARIDCGLSRSAGVRSEKREDEVTSEEYRDAVQRRHQRQKGGEDL